MTFSALVTKLAVSSTQEFLDMTRNSENYTMQSKSEWKPFSEMPQTGEFFLVCDAQGKMAVGNMPENCNFGLWYYSKKEKEWCGAAFFSIKDPTHYRPLPPLPFT